MSSTFVHYQQPGSLPSDYAIISRYTGHHPNAELQNESNSDTESEDVVGRASLFHRTNLSLHHHLQNPTTMSAQSHFKHIPAPSPIPSENTPLLNSPVSPSDGPLERTPNNGSTMKIFWEELRILARSAAPVFGCVYVFSMPDTNVER